MSTGTAAEPLLTAQNLSLERGGRQLFDGLSFEVLPSQLIQIDGANGAGKTSLLRILAGLSRYGFEGQISRPVVPLFLGHQSAVKGLLSPRENLAWHIAGAAEPSDAEIDEALAQVGLYGYEDTPSHALSAGQHRRVNIARLFLSASPLWLLDEPFTAIDAAGVAAIEALLQQHLEGGGAVVLSSHQPLQTLEQVQLLSLVEGLL
jgi:heme exporter protein A